MIKNFKHLLELAKEKESNKIAVVAADDKVDRSEVEVQ